MGHELRMRVVNLSDSDIRLLTHVLSMDHTIEDDECVAHRLRGKSCGICRADVDLTTRTKFWTSIMRMRPVRNVLEMFRLLNDEHCMELRKQWAPIFHAHSRTTLQVITDEIVPELELWRDHIKEPKSNFGLALEDLRKEEIPFASLTTFHRGFPI